MKKKCVVYSQSHIHKSIIFLICFFQQFSTVTDDLDPHLQESLATTKEWKQLKLKKDHDAGIVTDEEAFMFFVGALDGETNAQSKEKEESTTTVVEEGPAVLIDIEESDLIYNVKPLYIPSKERQIMEDKIYHYPSAVPGM